eukprot:1007700_1
MPTRTRGRKRKTTADNSSNTNEKPKRRWRHRHGKGRKWVLWQKIRRTMHSKRPNNPLSNLLAPDVFEELASDNKSALSGAAMLNDIRNYCADVFRDNQTKLGKYKFPYPADFVDRFKAVLGGDMWESIGDWYANSPIYAKYFDDK